MHEFKVGGIGCSSCAGKIQRAIHSLDGNARVDLDIGSGRLRVASNVGAIELATAIVDAGYTVQPTGARTGMADAVPDGARQAGRMGRAASGEVNQ